MLESLYMAGVRCLPRRALSRMARPVSDLPSAWAVRTFAAAFRLDMDEAELPLEGYRSVHELFVRRLRPGARPVDPSPGALVSPVDGTVSQLGLVPQGDLPQAKGRTYSLEALLAGAEAPSRFRSGAFVTIYLSPRDYHRVHAPAEGYLRGWTHVPGDLFPVNPASTARVSAVFARNERLITHLDTEAFGRVALVKVGATVVGRVRASYDPAVTTNRPGPREIRSERYPSGRSVRRGEELAVFEMGSTVIVLTERPLPFEVGPGDPVLYGRRLGTAP